MLPAGLLGAIGSLLAPAAAPAQAPVLTYQWNPTNFHLSLSLPANSAYYYNIQRSTNLFLTAPASAAIGRDPFAVTLTVPQTGPAGFFRAELISIFAPQDTDGDGIDDLYELDHSDILDPLNPADAGRDPDGNGLTHLQEYRLLFGFEDKPAQAFSREVTGFNFGAPSARLEAMTREISTFNFGAAAWAYEAHSKEVSLYAGESPAQTFILQAYTREVSAFNFGAGDGAVYSREVSAFAGETPAPTFILQVYSREVSAFNFGAPSAPYEAISREVSAQNFFQP